MSATVIYIGTHADAREFKSRVKGTKVGVPAGKCTDGEAYFESVCRALPSIGEETVVVDLASLAAALSPPKAVEAAVIMAKASASLPCRIVVLDQSSILSEGGIEYLSNLGERISVTSSEITARDLEVNATGSGNGAPSALTSATNLAPARHPSTPRPHIAPEQLRVERVEDDPFSNLDQAFYDDDDFDPFADLPEPTLLDDQLDAELKDLAQGQGSIVDDLFEDGSVMSNVRNGGQEDVWPFDDDDDSTWGASVLIEEDGEERETETRDHNATHHRTAREPKAGDGGEPDLFDDDEVSTGLDGAPNGGFGRFNDPDDTDSADDPFSLLEGAGSGGLRERLEGNLFDDDEDSQRGMRFGGDTAGDQGWATEEFDRNHIPTLEDVRGLLKYNSEEPCFDYDDFNEANQKGRGFRLFGGGKKVKIGETEATSLCSSTYIEEMNVVNGYYDMPSTSKIITVWSAKGGTGKTTISSMIGVQLNWFFNESLMMHRTMENSNRVLILSLNEFDDLSCNDIGYEESISKDHINDGKDISELLTRIDRANGEPSWDDIEDCFAMSVRNYVYYLPRVPLRKKKEGDIIITADDYKRVIEVCSRFFPFIILDSPDIFYEQKNDLMDFAFINSDVIVFVVEADGRSTVNLYEFFDSMKADRHRRIDRDKCLLCVNKYVTPGNPYVLDHAARQSVRFEALTKVFAGYFAQAVAIPLTEYRAVGNVLFGKDPQVKIAAAEMTDEVLKIIDSTCED